MPMAMFGGTMDWKLAASRILECNISFKVNFSPYWVEDAISTRDTPACQSKGLFIRAIEVDVSIAQEASPDWRHTKWNISHSGALPGTDGAVFGQPMFDYTPRDECDGESCKPNPCGKADVLHKMWSADIDSQLYG